MLADTSGTYANDWDPSGQGTYYYNASQTTIYAVWTANTYTIGLNKNHGDTTPWTPGTATVYQKYDFGWFTDSTATVPIGHLDGGGNSAPPITTPARTGYDFAGYYTSATNKTGTRYMDADGYMTASRTTYLAADTTLYAGWDAHHYTVNYYTNHAGDEYTLFLSQSGIAYGTTYDYPSMASGAPVAAPTREGYTFMGWHTARSGVASTALGRTTTTFASLTPDEGGVINYYALWKVNENAIAYDMGGVEVFSAPANGKYLYTDTSVRLPAAPAPQNNKFFFSGWQVTTPGSAYTEGGTPGATGFTQDAVYASGAIVPISRAWGDVVLTATWTETEGVEARSGILKIPAGEFEYPRVYAEAVVETYLDGQKSRMDSVELWQGGARAFAMAWDAAAGHYAFLADTSEATGAYEVHVNGKNTGVTVGFGGAAAQVFYQSVTVVTRLNGVETDAEAVQLKNGGSTQSLGWAAAGRYTDVMQVPSLSGDNTVWEVWLDGENTGKTVQYAPGANTVTIDRWGIVVNVRLDGAPADFLGAGVLKRAGAANVPLAQTSVGVYEALGYGDARAWQVWLGGKNTGRTAAFATGQNTVDIDYYTARVTTRLNGANADIGALSLVPVGGGEALSPAMSGVGVYEAVALGAATQYKVYANGADTGKTLRFAPGETDVELDFFTVTYQNTDAAVTGIVPADNTVYLSGTKATALGPGSLQKPDDGPTSFSFDGCVMNTIAAAMTPNSVMVLPRRASFSCKGVEPVSAPESSFAILPNSVLSPTAVTASLQKPLVT